MSKQIDIRTLLVNKMMIDEVTGCWNWNGNKNSKGYGLFYGGLKSILAHRNSYSYFNNQVIPTGMMVCHHCDNTSCINPSHLFLGTAKSNSEDMMKKNRDKHCEGENSGRSKLKNEQVLEIKKLISQGVSNRDVASKFRIHYSTVSLIRNGKRWKHLQSNDFCVS